MQNHSSIRQRLSLLAVLAAVLFVAIPLLSPGYMLDQYTLVVIYAIAILGLNLVTGYGGAITLGHGAFFTLGAYSCAILMMKYGWSPLAAVPVSALLCWVAGLLFGYPALRLHGLYLALGTLALAVSVTPLLKRFEGLTGGHQGIVVDMPSAPKWLPINDTLFTYYLCLVIGVVLFAGAWLVVRGALGRSILALRDNPLVASVMSVNRARTTTLLFAMSSFYAGIAGALFGMTVGFVSPDSFPLMLSLSFFIAGVVGGLTSISGAVYGALFIQFVPTLASDIEISLSGLVYGAALIVFALLLPNGVAGGLQRLWTAIRSRTGSNPPVATPTLQMKDKPGA